MKKQYNLIGLVTAALLFISSSLMAHVTEIRVNQNQDGSLTWYLQTYHRAGQCGVQNSGLSINGVRYPLQYERSGSVVPLSPNVFAVATSGWYTISQGRYSYAVVRTPYIPGVLNVQPYSSNVCWAFAVGGNGSFTPPPPPVCTSFPVTGASYTLSNARNLGTPCDLSDDRVDISVNVQHLVCGDITGDKQFSWEVFRNGNSMRSGNIAYNSGNSTTLSLPNYFTGNAFVRFTDNDFPGDYYDLPLSFSGVTENIAPNISCPFDIVVNNDPGICGAVVNFDDPSATDNCGTGGLPTSLSGYTYQGIHDGHAYFLSNSTAKPEDAHAAAIATGGHLATISDFAENQFISQMSSSQIWIGLTDRDSEGNWGWVTSEPYNYTNWAPGEPNNAGGNEDWAVINWTAGNPDWNDWYFSVSTYYVVEFDGGSIPTTQIGGPASGSVFPIGTTTVTYEAVDGSGNRSTCSFDVTVNDTEAPQVNVQNATVTLDANGQGDIFTAPSTTTVFSEDWSGLSAGFQSGGTLGAFNLTGNVDIGDYNNSMSGLEIDLAGNNNSTIETQSAINFTPGSYTFKLNHITNTNPNPNNSVRVVIGSMFDQTFASTTSVQNESVNFTVSAAEAATIKVIQLGTDDASGTFIGSLSVDRNNPAGLAIDAGSSDNCGIQSSVASQTNFTCADLGSNQVTLTVTDVNGLVTTKTATVTVVDNIAPSVSTQNATVVLDANGQGSISVSDIENGSSDVCGIASSSLDVSSFSCADVGTNTVTLTVTDHSGNSNTGTATVTVIDNIDPSVVTQNAIVNLDANGQGSISVSDVDGGSSDACGIASSSLDVSSFSCADVGANTVTLTVTDNNGNSAVGTAVVTVVDDVDPVAIAQNATVVLNASGNGSITAADIDNGSNDACGIASTSLDVTSFSCADVGANTVTLTVTDNNGNSSTATATVTVVDNTAPSVATQNATVMLDASGNGSITVSDIDNGSNDACGIASTSLDNTNFSCADVGANTVTLTVTDNNGNSATGSATVTVLDNIAPSVVTQNATVQLDASGNGSITVADIDNGSNDACGVATTSLDITSFGCDDVGSNLVTLTVTDVNGNSATGTANVDVIATPLVTSLSSPTTNGYNISCHGGSDGSIDLTVSQGCAPYSYAWSNGATTEDLSGLTAGTYSVTVTDASGTVTSNENITLTEPAPLAATTSSSGYLSGPGVTGNTLYLGYGPQSINLSASTTGGVAPYSYSWNNAGSLSGATTATPVASPQATTTYTVTITDANGCVTTGNVTVGVIDARCGKKGKKVALCHNGKTICVSKNAVASHLAHANHKKWTCSLGPCGATAKNEGALAASFDYHLYPNPTQGAFTLQIHSEQATDARFVITDLQGRVIAVKEETTAEGTTEYRFDLSQYAAGVYMLNVITPEQRFTERIVKQ